MALSFSALIGLPILKIPILWTHTGALKLVHRALGVNRQRSYCSTIDNGFHEIFQSALNSITRYSSTIQILVFQKIPRSFRRKLPKLPFNLRKADYTLYAFSLISIFLSPNIVYSFGRKIKTSEQIKPSSDIPTV